MVVDSHSTDGTVEYLQANLRHPRLRIVQHPRGLYQSWNAGIALLSTEYVFIATAGDAMPRAGAEHLLAVAERFDADIVVSPPKFIDKAGREVPKISWPVHDVLREVGATEPFLPDAKDMMRWTFVAGGNFSGILGSSASNLYRTRLLQAHPFPTDAGRCGDVAWGLRYVAKAKVAFTPQVCAEFVFHNEEGTVSSVLRKSIVRAAADGVGLSVDAVYPQLVGLSAQTTIIEHHQAALRRIRRLLGPAWHLWPMGWHHRKVRDQARAAIRRVVENPEWPESFRAFAWVGVRNYF